MTMPLGLRDFKSMGFPYKLWHMTNDSSISSIDWNESGDGLVIDSVQFQTEILGNSVMFKTNCLSSFLRQLNLYGFRKIRWSNKPSPITPAELTEPIGGCNRDSNASPRDLQQFRHPYFLINHHELLDRITRRQSQSMSCAAGKENQQPSDHATQHRFNKMVAGPTAARDRASKNSAVDKSRRALSAALRDAMHDNVKNQRSCKLATEVRRIPYSASYCPNSGDRYGNSDEDRWPYRYVSSQPRFLKNFNLTVPRVPVSKHCRPGTLRMRAQHSEDTGQHTAAPLLSDWIDRSSWTRHGKSRHNHFSNDGGDAKSHFGKPDAFTSLHEIIQRSDESHSAVPDNTAAWQVWKNASLDDPDNEWWTDITSLYSCEDAYMLNELMDDAHMVL